MPVVEGVVSSYGEQVVRRNADDLRSRATMDDDRRIVEAAEKVLTIG
ncbi:hypothetical protein [Natrinema hispanicum]|nr:hypothetical protein [Natrinema hispanicum]